MIQYTLQFVCQGNNISDTIVIRGDKKDKGKMTKEEACYLLKPYFEKNDYDLSKISDLCLFGEEGECLWTAETFL